MIQYCVQVRARKLMKYCSLQQVSLFWWRSQSPRELRGERKEEESQMTAVTEGPTEGPGSVSYTPACHILLVSESGLQR